ncbi:MAG: type II toxin-antitoxin system VapC family toxin [Alphaproteobacteria bacterium]|nr:type II toxin-antitoxin system VapC family toxin [Alphaproteobacteria bacterium]
MILIHTNVISEPWKVAPDPHVLAWIDAQAIETLYLSAVTVAELRLGIAAMTAGKRRTTLHDRLERDVLPLFDGRVLPFDLDTSQAYADLMAQAKLAGKSIGKADGYIAATAAAHSLMVATRDTSPFEAAGLNFINPWIAELKES